MNYGGLDILRHVLSLAVVFQHMTSSSRYSSDINTFIANTIDYIDGNVAGFFLIGGFFLKLGERLNPSHFRTFINGSVIRLAIPYFVFSIFYAVAMAALNKSPLWEGLVRTFSLRGASMQLYFLPYLFGISTFLFVVLSAFPDKYRLIGSTFVTFALLSSAFEHRTPTSTGADPRLLLFYAFSFSLGILFKLVWRQKHQWIALAAALTPVLLVALGSYDKRFLDLALVFSLFTIAVFSSGHIPILQRRFPGSGGVYLLHTPIVNFAISSLLANVGMSGYPNLLFSWALTYALCLLTTLTIISWSRRARIVFLE